jgi:hypothetical protein
MEFRFRAIAPSACGFGFTGAALKNPQAVVLDAPFHVPLIEILP